MKIKLRRIEIGLTQRDLAKKVGITAQFLWKIEKNQADIRLSLMKRIAKELDTTVQELFLD